MKTQLKSSNLLMCIPYHQNLSEYCTTDSWKFHSSRLALFLLTVFIIPHKIISDALQIHGTVAHNFSPLNHIINPIAGKYLQSLISWK